MLSSFRNASNSIFIKILFGAIILSFCLWGIGDIIRGYSSSRSVVSVGKTKVTAETFMREYNQGKQNIKNNSKTPISEAELKKIDVKSLVMHKLVQESVLDQTYQNMNITIPKKSILNIVQSLDEFQRDGSFSDELYATAIRRSGINEAGFLNQIRENLARTQLLHPIMSGYNIPNIAKEKIAEEFETKKTILVGRVKLSSAKLDKSPTDEEIKQYFDSNSEKYKIPEKRDVAILVVDYSNLSKDLKVSNEEIDAQYKSNENSFTTPSKRDFERFTFDDRESADKAWNMINKGHKTKEIIKKFAPKVDSINGVVAGSLHGSVGKELFELKLNRTSNVYESDGKFYLYKVTKIEPSKKMNEEESKKEIEKSLQNEKMNSPEFYGKIKGMKNRIDDGFGSGKPIDVIAKETGMKIVELKSIDAAGKNAEFEKLIQNPETKKDVQEAIFSTPESEASQTIDSKEKDTLSYVVYVRHIEKGKLVFTNEIAKQVRADFISEKEDKKIQAQVNAITNKGKDAASDVSELKGVHSYKLSKKDVLLYEKEHGKEVEKILSDVPNLNVILNILSTLNVGEAVNYKLPDGDYVVIAVQNRSLSPSVEPDFNTMISKYVDSGSGNDINSIAMSAFKSQLDVKIDEKLLKEITTTVDEQENNN